MLVTFMTALKSKKRQQNIHGKKGPNEDCGGDTACLTKRECRFQNVNFVILNVSITLLKLSYLTFTPKVSNFVMTVPARQLCIHRQGLGQDNTWPQRGAPRFPVDCLGVGLRHL